MSAAGQPSAIVLGGGGARAAYQVGALRAIAQLQARGTPLPFPIVCGTSAGAINAATIAMHADDFRRGVARLARWWRRIGASHVYRSDFGSLSRHSAQFLAAVLTGAHAPEGVASVLDNTPLSELLRNEFDWTRIDDRVRDGSLRALAINATSYSTGTLGQLLPRRARHNGLAAHAPQRPACAAFARSPACEHRDPVPVSGGAHRT